MCGIVGSIGGKIGAGLAAVAHRGPDASGRVRVGNVKLGHSRLAIVDVDSRSDQPFKFGKTIISFNGEIWNHRDVRKKLELAGRTFATTSDTETFAAALDEWGPEALPKFNGMFAIAWVGGDGKLWLARDRFGEIPLHVEFGNHFRFASEKKALIAMGADPSRIEDVGPGEVWEIEGRVIKKSRWYDPPADPVSFSKEGAATKLRRCLRGSVKDRAMSDVPVCTLLSGGIDSAVVAMFLSREVKNLVAYTAVLNEKSSDLKAARETVDFLGIELREIRVPVPTPEDLSEVIRVIEMPFKAQVEIGWPCLHLARAMKRDGFKVTFSGEGSDELWASYAFSYHGLKKQDWHSYRKNLFLDQARKNFPRANKAFMHAGVECRLPFLHPSVVELALSMPRNVVQDGKSRPKAVLQDAFIGRLPESILNRRKIAFQDGMGMKEAIVRVVANPKRFYAAEHEKMYGSLRKPATI